MTNQVVVINKDKVARSPYSEMIQASIDVLIKHGVATTITLDDDIEKRAEELFSANDGFFKSIDKEAVIKFATEQQIISEMKIKDKKDVEFIHHCGNEVTKKEAFFDHCLKCGEYFDEF